MPLLKRLVASIFGGRLQVVLSASFALVAALTVGLAALVISQLIEDYLAEAQDERVARDMDLAGAFYRLKQDDVTTIGYRMVFDPRVYHNLSAALQGQAEALAIIDQELTRKITVPNVAGSHLIAIVDAQGELVLGRTLSIDGVLSDSYAQGNWADLPIVAAALDSGSEQTGTEVIPAELLAQVGLKDQAAISLIDTPRAAPQAFDPREGTAGMAIVGVYPIQNGEAASKAFVVVAHLFNNDFTLVDRIKEIAGVDTATIFFGDLRVSTNVPDEQGNRAVGTRMSAEVREVVLAQGLAYKGEAFVVNETYITRYEPLRDHRGQVVGSLYVGARVSAFQRLVQDFQARVALIALVCVVLAGVIAIPIARFVTRPIAELVRANRQLARGDMSVRVPASGRGELALLASSFNTMVATLDQTQQDLLRQEKLASMGQLAAGVAHEINNPLGTILLLADVLFKEMPADGPQRDDLKLMIDEATRAKNIVADLLNFARQQQVQAQETDLHILLEQVIASIQHQPSFEGVAVIRQFSPNLPIIQADPAQLQQVFINLLNNAAEAMESGGAITVATRSMDHQWVEICISDTGPGIPEEHLGKLFTPFFTTKALGKGTGLGLSIVYGIIKMHRGQIAVQSQVGKGSSFTVTLPVRLPPST